MKRNIKYLVAHCTGTPGNTSVESIERYWKEERGWKNPGYHYIILPDGTIVQLLSEDKIANGVKGFNENSIHFSYVGGIDAHWKSTDTRTAAQQESMFNLLMELSEKYPNAIMLGHRDFPGVTKSCPGFDFKTWIAGYLPDINSAA